MQQMLGWWMARGGGGWRVTRSRVPFKGVPKESCKKSREGPSQPVPIKVLLIVEQGPRYAGLSSLRHPLRNNGSQTMAKKKKAAKKAAKKTAKKASKKKSHR